MQIIRYTGQAEADVEAQSDTGFLSDQLINQGEYEPLLPTREELTQLLNSQYGKRQSMKSES